MDEALEYFDSSISSTLHSVVESSGYTCQETRIIDSGGRWPSAKKNFEISITVLGSIFEVDGSLGFRNPGGSSFQLVEGVKDSFVTLVVESDWSTWVCKSFQKGSELRSRNEAPKLEKKEKVDPLVSE